MFILSSTGDCGVYVYRGTVTLSSVTTGCGRNINDGQWRHFAWTIDSRGTWTLYLNGLLVGTYTGYAYPNGISRQSNYFGQSNWGGQVDPFLNGAIDEFYMYLAVMSASQVKALYIQGKVFNSFDSQGNRAKLFFCVKYVNTIIIYFDFDDKL